MKPWNTPDECDHEGEKLRCTHCCDCQVCSRIREEEAGRSELGPTATHDVGGEPWRSDQQ